MWLGKREAYARFGSRKRSSYKFIVVRHSYRHRGVGCCSLPSLSSTLHILPSLLPNTWQTQRGGSYSEAWLLTDLPMEPLGVVVCCVRKEAEKPFGEHPVIIKTLSKLRIERNFPQCDKGQLRKSYS